MFNKSTLDRSLKFSYGTVKIISLYELAVLCIGNELNKLIEDCYCIAVDWEEVRLFMNNTRHRYLKTVFFPKQKIACTRYTKDEEFNRLIDKDYNSVPVNNVIAWRDYLMKEIAECLIFNKRDGEDRNHD
jgi:hypothetical protein